MLRIYNHRSQVLGRSAKILISQPALSFVALFPRTNSDSDDLDCFVGERSLVDYLFPQSFKRYILFAGLVFCFSHLNADAQQRPADVRLRQPTVGLQGITIKGALTPSGCTPESVAEISRKQIVLRRIFFTSAGLGGAFQSRRDDSFLGSGDSVLVRGRPSIVAGRGPIGPVGQRSFVDKQVVSRALLTRADQDNLLFEFAPKRLTSREIQENLSGLPKPNLDGKAWISTAVIQRANSIGIENVDESRGSGIQVLHLAYFAELEDSTLQTLAGDPPAINQFAFVPRRYIQVLPSDSTRDVGRIPVLCIIDLPI